MKIQPSLIVYAISQTIIASVPIILSFFDKKTATDLKWDTIANHFDAFRWSLIAILITSCLVSIFSKRNMVNLLEEKEDFERYLEVINLRSKMRKVLRDIAEEIDFESKECRITAYYFSARFEQMFSLGRYSKAPEYDKNGRLIIKDSNEYVFKVLNQEEEKHIQDAPTKMGRKRRMKSRSIYGVGLTDKNNTLIGVVIFQHMQEQYFSPKKRKKIANHIRMNNDKILSVLDYESLAFDFHFATGNESTFDQRLES